MPNRVQNNLCDPPGESFVKKTETIHLEVIMYPTDVRRTSKNSSNAVRVLDVHWISDTWREVSSRCLADVC